MRGGDLRGAESAGPAGPWSVRIAAETGGDEGVQSAESASEAQDTRVCRRGTRPPFPGQVRGLGGEGKAARPCAGEQHPKLYLLSALLKTTYLPQEPSGFPQVPSLPPHILTRHLNPNLNHPFELLITEFTCV